MPRRIPARSTSQCRQESSDLQDLDPELLSLSEAALRDRIGLFEDRHAKISRDRNYMQLERDMVCRFYETAQKEVKALDAEMLDMDKQMQDSQRDHKVQLKVHEQTVHRLEYFHKEDRRMAPTNAEAALQIECEDHSTRSVHMGCDKRDMRRDLREQQSEFEEDADMISRGFCKRLDQVRATFEQKEREMQAQYGHQLGDLKADLSLQKKAEMHELEERKNKHINELKLNNQEALADAKAEWKHRAKDELNLIKTLREDIKKEQERQVANKQQAKALARENDTLAAPLEAKLAEQAVLEEKLKGRVQVPAAYKNRAALLKRLKEQEELTKKEYRTTEEQYRRVEKSRDDLNRDLRMALSERERKADLRQNRVIEKKLERCTEQYDKKREKLSEVIGQAKLEPIEAMHIAKGIETVVGVKNRRIRNLQYKKQQATKTYDDTIAVYEAKLPRLGINPNEIGFDNMGVGTPKMPAGLVARVR